MILGQGGNTLLEVAPWAGTMLVASASALVGAAAPKGSTAKAALLVATLLFAVLGFLALFTIGLLFVVATVLTAVAFAKVTRDEPESVT